MGSAFLGEHGGNGLGFRGRRRPVEVVEEDPLPRDDHEAAPGPGHHVGVGRLDRGHIGDLVDLGRRLDKTGRCQRGPEHDESDGHEPIVVEFERRVELALQKTLKAIVHGTDLHEGGEAQKGEMGVGHDPVGPVNVPVDRPGLLEGPLEEEGNAH